MSRPVINVSLFALLFKELAHLTLWVDKPEKRGNAHCKGSRLISFATSRNFLHQMCKYPCHCRRKRLVLKAWKGLNDHFLGCVFNERCQSDYTGASKNQKWDFSALTSFNCDYYSLRLMKTQNSVSHKIRILHKNNRNVGLLKSKFICIYSILGFGSFCVCFCISAVSLVMLCQLTQKVHTDPN